MAELLRVLFHRENDVVLGFRVGFELFECRAAVMHNMHHTSSRIPIVVRFTCRGYRQRALYTKLYYFDTENCISLNLVALPKMSKSY